MSISSVRARVNSLEAELHLLRTEIEKTHVPNKEIKSFPQLEGIWSKEKELTEEEIKEAEIKLPEGL